MPVPFLFKSHAMKKIEKSLLKIAILNDMLLDEFMDLNPNLIQDRTSFEKILKLRLRGSRKSAEMLSSSFNEAFDDKGETSMLFGKAADAMIDNFDLDFENFIKHNTIKDPKDRV